jgi:hypothetical protein
MNDIITAFLNERKINPDIEWAEYIRQFYSSRNDNILITYLTKVAGLHIDTLYDFSTDDWTQIVEYRDSIKNKRKKNMDKKYYYQITLKEKNYDKIF